MPPLTHSLLPHSLPDRSLFLLHFVTSGLAIKISRPPPSPSSSKVRAGVWAVLYLIHDVFSWRRKRCSLCIGKGRRKGEENSVTSIHGIFYFVKIGCTERASLWRQERWAISLHPPAPAFMRPPPPFIFLSVFSPPRPNNRRERSRQIASGCFGFVLSFWGDLARIAFVHPPGPTPVHFLLVLNTSHAIRPCHLLPLDSVGEFDQPFSAL